jgi:hypothetical protein
MRDKEQFIEIFNSSIRRDGADKLMEWLEKSDFFTAPASTRFHGNYEGGLCKHSLNVYKELKRHLALLDQPENISEETVAVVSLLHDLCKVNFYKRGTKNVKDDSGVWTKKETWEIEEKFPCGEHADKSIILIQQFMQLLPEEILAIRAHMGGFDASVRGGAYMIGNIFGRSRLAVQLHCADLTATYFLENEESNN